ncbi:MULTISPECIES: ABC transporter permease [unclassified Ruminococcus]|uniref:ABC transporter permease n=1 Tax=unclassified Ruminococcus TaxID=2608920 RepID=UPI00210C42C0|nr:MULTISPECIES: ABC transporter permease [unclassified Ruminococcus]
MFDIFKEHKGFGRQIVLLAKNELIKTYKGSAVGPLWAVVKPLFTLFVYWFAFSIGLRGNKVVEVANIHGETIGYPIFIFILVGFVPWCFISDSIIFGARSIRDNRQFVTKVSFPVSTIMSFTVLSKLFVHFLLVGCMYIYVIFTTGGPSIYNIQFIMYCPLMFLFFLVLSWSTAPMSAFSLDFFNIINSIMSGLFWLSSVIYSSYDLEEGWLRVIMLFNPINYFTNGYRNAFLYKRWFWDYPQFPLETLIFVAEFALLFVLGLYNYKRLRKKIADVL